MLDAQEADYFPGMSAEIRGCTGTASAGRWADEGHQVALPGGGCTLQNCQDASPCCCLIAASSPPPPRQTPLPGQVQNEYHTTRSISTTPCLCQSDWKMAHWHILGSSIDQRIVGQMSQMPVMGETSCDGVGRCFTCLLPSCSAAAAAAAAGQMTCEADFLHHLIHFYGVTGKQCNVTASPRRDSACCERPADVAAAYAQSPW